MEESELETLKDFDFKEYVNYKETPITAWEFAKRKLKAQAIKRVKNCCPNDNLGGIPLRKNKRCIACERDIWFYNLTEEDLKNENM